MAVAPALDPDPRAFRDGATLSGLVRARDPTTYDGYRLHRIRPWVGEPQAGVVLRRVSCGFRFDPATHSETKAVNSHPNAALTHFWCNSGGGLRWFYKW